MFCGPKGSNQLRQQNNQVATKQNNQRQSRAKASANFPLPEDLMKKVDDASWPLDVSLGLTCETWKTSSKDSTKGIQYTQGEKPIRIGPRN